MKRSKAKSRRRTLAGTRQATVFKKIVAASPSFPSMTLEGMDHHFTPLPPIHQPVAFGLALIQDEPMRESLAELQRILGYSLNDPRLLLEALTHPSHPSRPNYQRLEHVGDAALNIIFTNFLFDKYPTFEPGPLTMLRSANVSTEKLARVSVRHGFYRFVRSNSLDNDLLVEEFTKSVLKEDADAIAAAAFGGTAVKAPKVLADIVESIAAAVYVDAGYDSQLLWKVFEPLLQPIITAETLDEQPVTKVHNLCQKLGKHILFADSVVRGMYVVKIVVDGVIIAESTSEHKTISKLNAAREALSHLQKSIKVYEQLGGSGVSDEEAIVENPSCPMIVTNLGRQLAATKQAKIVNNVGNKSGKQFAAKQVIREICPTSAGEVRVGAKQELHQFCGKDHCDFPIYSREGEEGPAHIVSTKQMIREICPAGEARVGAKQELHQFRGKNHGDFPIYSREREEGPAHIISTKHVVREICPTSIGEARVGAKQELHQFCGKNHWDFPIYTREREESPAHVVSTKQVIRELCPAGEARVGAKQELHHFCGKNHWDLPIYNREREEGPAYIVSTKQVIREICPAREARIGAKQELHQLCGKNHWDFPIYNREREEGPAHDKRFVASVLVKTTDVTFIMESGLKQTVKEAENHAAFGMLIKFLGMKSGNDVET